jgi:cell division septation protein DedD
VTVSPPRNGEAPTEKPKSIQAAGRPLCPRCGTPHEPNQEYCLECGLRLPVEASGLIPRLGRAWRRQLGWYPGDWVWPSLLALLIAALAGIGAAAFVSHDQKRADYVTGTSPFGAPPVTVPPPPERTTPTFTAPTTSTGTQPTPPKQTTAPPPALTEWPAGKSGWTVVLGSLPTANGRAFALAQARAAEHSGLQAVGIIDSSQYASLHPGYYVLFTGVYTSFDDANTAATTAQSRGYRRAYPRRITP